MMSLRISKASLPLFFAGFYVSTLGALPDYLSLGLLLITLVLTALFFLASPARQYLQSLLVLAASLLLVCSLSAYVTYCNELDLDRAVQMSLRLMLIPFFLACGMLAGAYGRTESVLIVVLVVCVAHSLAGFVSVFLGAAPVIGGVVRPDGFLTPNVTANSAMLGAIVSFACFRDPDRTWAKRLKFAYLFLFFMSFVVVSATLKNIVALLPALVAVSYLRSRNYFALRAAIALAILAPLGVVSLLVSPAGDRFADVYDAALRGGLTSSTSLGWRVEHWSALLHDWNTNFFWTGGGVGQSINMAGVRAVYGGGAVAHNDWLAILVEFGPVLGCFLLLALGVPVVRALRAASSTLFYSIVLSSTMALAIAMAGGNVMFTASFLYVYWLLVGAALGQGFDRNSRHWH